MVDYDYLQVCCVVMFGFDMDFVDKWVGGVDKYYFVLLCFGGDGFGYVMC